MELKDLDHLRAFDAVRFKSECVAGEEFTIVCYMIADPAVWNEKLGVETRGHVFDASGRCVAMPFEKFFNYRENRHTQPEVIGHLRVKHAFDKRDGSLISPVALNNGQIAWKSKKSFSSDVADAVANGGFENQERMSAALIAMGFSPVFEYTDPQFKIVIDYGNKPELVCLAARDMRNGAYMDWDILQFTCDHFDVPLVSRVNVGNRSIEEIERDLQDAEGIEGYVLELENGMRIKLKTPWYLRLHHVNTELRERDIAEMFVDETLDDVKSAISLAGLSLDPVEQIERQVSDELNDIMDRTRELFGWIRLQSSRKEAAEKFRGNDVFGLAMRLLDGKDADYKQFWKRNHLKQYTLRCVYNHNFSQEQS